LFARDTLSSPYLSYGTASYGTNLKVGVPLREDLSFQGRYSIYWSQINLVSSLNDCNNVNPNFATTFPSINAANAATLAGVINSAYPGYAGAVAGSNQSNCLMAAPSLGGSQLNVASLPVREELAAGGYLTSMIGYGLTYNTLDNNKRPTSGVLVSFGQDIAGLGGNAKYLRTVVDFRTYYEVVSDLVGVMHLQGGDMLGLSKGPNGESNYVRMLDDFKVGPNVVRGFQPAGIGPRDITPGTAGDSLGGTYYWGASLEVQYPFYFLPKDSGFRGAVFVDSGAEWGYKGETSWPSNGEVNGLITTSTGVSYVCGNCALQFADTAAPRLSVGASLIWDSPFGPLRFDFAYPILKQAYDRTQWFQFGGGTRF
jgi:outer membrane protein insertion porin family